MLVLHGSIENHDGSYALLPNALRQIANGVHPVSFRIDPLRALLEHRRQQALFAATRERTDHNELPPDAVGGQNSERRCNRRHRRGPIPFELAAKLRIRSGTRAAAPASLWSPRGLVDKFRQRPHETEQSFSCLSWRQRWWGRTSKIVCRCEVECDALFSAIAIRNQRLLDRVDAPQYVSPAGMKRCPQLVEQLVHGRI